MQINSRTTASLPLLMLALVVVVVVMVTGTATASPQFGNQVVYDTLPRGVKATNIPRQCNPACVRIYFPVCGTDGKTYGNMCVLRFFECAYRNMTLAYPRPCVPGGDRGVYPAQCPTLCQAYYEPVCGSDGQTYANLCILQVVACRNPSLGLTLGYDGECAPKTERPKTCPTVCPAIYQPVCGTDGKTYPNQCVLESAACIDLTLTIANPGECASNSGTTPGNTGTQGNRGQFPVDTPTRRIPGQFPVNPSTNRIPVDTPTNRIPSFFPRPFNPSVNVSPPRRERCRNTCDRVYIPVCGNDGRTYYSACVLELVACRERKGISVAHVGRCDGAGGVVSA